MVTEKINLAYGNPVLLLGRQGDNEVTAFAFDFSTLIENVGAGGVLELYVKRSDMNTPYIAETTVDGNIATWVVKNTDTVAGNGQLEAKYILDGAVKWHRIYKTFTDVSMGESGSVPEPYEDWVQEVYDAVQEATRQASLAKDEADKAEDTVENAIENNIKIYDLNDDGHIEVVIGGTA